MSDTISVERRGRVAYVTITRPPLNILDLTTIESLHRCLQDLGSDSGLQVLVLHGAGGKAFSAGVAVEDHTPDRVEMMLEEFHGALRLLLSIPAASIAVVEGHCLGGGMEVAAVCDLVIASEDSRFGQPEIKLGCFPPLAAALYPRLFGPQRTTEMLLTGRTLDAHEARQLGLVSRVVSRQQLDDALAELVAEITAHSAAVTRLTKRAILAGREYSFARALGECERLYNRELVATRDMQEGLEAFLEKRQPDWSHS